MSKTELLESTKGRIRFDWQRLGVEKISSLFCRFYGSYICKSFVEIDGDKGNTPLRARYYKDGRLCLIEN